MGAHFVAGRPVAPGEKAVFVPRPALGELVAALDRGKGCVLFGPQRLGKTSLARLVVARLRAAGRQAAFVSLYGVEDIAGDDRDGWLEELTARVCRELGIEARNAGGASWAMLLAELAPAGLVLVLDEVNELAQRAEIAQAILDPIFAVAAEHPGRLAFALVGNTRPDELGPAMARRLRGLDRIDLDDLDRPAIEAALAASELADTAPDLAGVLHEWCGGNPYVLQRLGEQLVELRRRGLAADDPAQWVEQAARRLVAGDDQDPVLDSTSRVFSRLAASDSERAQALALLRRVLAGEEPGVEADDGAAELLWLAGLVRRRRLRDGGYVLVSRGRFLAEAFGPAWVDREERLLARPFRDRIRRWRESGRRAGELLRGAELARARAWRGEHGHANLTLEESEFLAASEAAAQRTRALWITTALVVAVSVATGLAWQNRLAARENERLRASLAYAPSDASGRLSALRERAAQIAADEDRAAWLAEQLDEVRLIAEGEAGEHERRLAEARRERDQASAETTRMSQDLESARRDLGAAQGDLARVRDDLERTEADFERMRADRAFVTRERDEARASLTEARASLSTREAELARTEQELARARQDVVRYQRELAEALAQFVALQAERGGTTREELDRARGELESVRRQRDAAQAMLRTVRDDLAAHQRAVGDCRAALDRCGCEGETP